MGSRWSSNDSNDRDDVSNESDNEYLREDIFQDNRSDPSVDNELLRDDTLPDATSLTTLAEHESDISCSICYDPIRIKAVLDPCQHAFCYDCIIRWSEEKTECPLCKRRFEFLYHNIVSDLDYAEHHFPNHQSSDNTSPLMELAHQLSSASESFSVSSAAGATSNEASQADRLEDGSFGRSLRRSDRFQPSTSVSSYVSSAADSIFNYGRVGVVSSASDTTSVDLSSYFSLAADRLFNHFDSIDIGNSNSFMSNLDFGYNEDSDVESLESDFVFYAGGDRFQRQ